MEKLDYRELNFKNMMINGNISMICTGDTPQEVIKGLGFAITRLNNIALMRIEEIKEQNKWDY